jgi:branched-chain amino acid transport system permease protein
VEQAILSGAAVGALYVLMAIGFALNLEIADIVNVAHGAFVVGAMYATLELVERGVGLPIAIALTAVGWGAVSYPVYVLLIRPARAEKGHAFMIVFTLLLLSALTVIYQLAFSANIRSLRSGFGSVEIFGGTLTTPQVAAILIAVAASAGLYLTSRFTMIGKLAYVASLYPLGARSVGVPVNRIYAAVFVLSGVLAGLAGGMAMTFQSVEPTLGLRFIIVVFLIALVARTHLLGCLFVGLAYGIAQSVLGYAIDAATATTLTLTVLLVALLGDRMLEPVRAMRRRSAGARALTAEA